MWAWRTRDLDATATTMFEDSFEEILQLRQSVRYFERIMEDRPEFAIRIEHNCNSSTLLKICGQGQHLLWLLLDASYQYGTH